MLSLRHVCVNNLPKVALDSAQARIRTRDLWVALGSGMASGM